MIYDIILLEVILLKLTISKSKNSEHFYISQSYINSHGKSTTKTYKKLGSLKDLCASLNTDRDGVILWAKQQVALATQEYNSQNADTIVSLSNSKLIEKNTMISFNCGYLFLQSICSQLRLDNICRNMKYRHNFEYNIQHIFSDLIFTRILYPSSKRSSFEFAQSFLHKPSYDLHSIYRSLSVLAQESDYIQAELYRNSHHLIDRNSRILYYDCTNYYFEIEEEDDDRKYGKSKEHRPNPIVTMGLFMDGNGIPLAFDIFPGNLNEQKTLKPLEQKVIRDFDCSEFVYCSDSGLGSQDNKYFNNFGGRSYVITYSLKKLKAEDREIALSTSQFKKVGGNNQFIDLDSLDESDPEVFQSIYYKEIPIDGKKVSETLIVTYSPKYKAYQKNIREKQIQRAVKMVNKNGKLKKNRKNPNDPARFIKQTNITKHGEVAEEQICELDLEVIHNEAQYDGFYAVATNMNIEIEEIIAINKRRWQIEECFRIMKHEFHARPVYVQRADRIKAHFLVCFCALLVYRILELKLDNKYTAEQIISTLREMKLISIKSDGYIPGYERTDITDDLHEVFKFRTDYEHMTKAKIRNIEKISKSK